MFEIVLIVVILLLVFGAGKVRSAGSDLGATVRALRKGLRPPEPQTPPAAPDAEFPEVVAERARKSDNSGA